MANETSLSFFLEMVVFFVLCQVCCIQAMELVVSHKNVLIFVER